MNRSAIASVKLVNIDKFRSKIRLHRILNVVLIGLSVVLALGDYKERANLHKDITHVLGGASIAFLGDSITEDGGVWDWKLGRFSFNTQNFGQGSAGLRVISWMTKVRVIPRNHITTVSIMAGTNDASLIDPLSFARDYEATVAAYIDLIKYLEENNVTKIVITSAPPQNNQDNNQFIFRLNEEIKKYVATDGHCTYIDLWPILWDGEKVKPGMTSDGVHFTEKAYDLWAEQLRNVL